MNRRAQDKFVSHLISLSHRMDKGALSDLRQGLKTNLRQTTKMSKFVVPYLDGDEYYNKHWFYVVGAMYGRHPKNVKNNTFGKCFQILKNKGSGSIEKRFLTIVNAHPSDVHKHLFNAVNLLKSNDIGIDYYRLLSDLIYWSHPNHFIQNRWAEEFYKTNKNEEKNEE